MTRVTLYFVERITQLEAREAHLAQLMMESQKGDAQAYKILLTELRDLLMAFYNRKLKAFGMRENSLIEDLIQESLMAIHAKRHTYDNSKAFCPWFYAIARYKLVDHIRKNKNMCLVANSEELNWLIEESQMAHNELHESEISQHLQKLLSEITPNQRDILERVKLHGQSLKEVALAKDMSLSAVKVSVHRAMLNLEKAFARFEEARNAQH
jgi:RNA polymerase sigma-70 factor (ECF subfamily)